MGKSLGKSLALSHKMTLFLYFFGSFVLFYSIIFSETFIPNSLSEIRDIKVSKTDKTSALKGLIFQQDDTDNKEFNK